MRYAVVINGIVHNTIVWDGVSEYAPPEGSILIHLGESEWCSIDSIYDPNADPRFTAPPQEPSE
jgi:hypothetical protein